LLLLLLLLLYSHALLSQFSLMSDGKISRILSENIRAISELRWAVSVTALIALSGSITALIALSGSVTALIELPVSVTALIALSGSVTVLIALPGSVTALIALSGSVIALIALSGSIIILIALSGSVTALIVLFGFVTALIALYDSLVASIELFLPGVLVTFYGPTDPSVPRPPPYRGFTITLRHTTLRRTPLDEWSTRRRDLYLTTNNTQTDRCPCPQRD
jgi:hypothetical protein